MSLPPHQRLPHQAHDDTRAEGGVAARARRLGTALQIQPGEFIPLLWCWIYIFCVLMAYYVIRPIRDTMGIAGGVGNLQWLFAGTLLGMLLANLPFAALTRRLPRARFITLSYRFFALNLVIFALFFLFSTASESVWVGRAFFIWVSVFNLFAVSIFWALVVDVFDQAQGKRLFGLIGAAATCGAIVGSGFTAALARLLPPAALLVLAALLLEGAVFAVRRLSATHGALRQQRDTAQEPLGGTILAGIRATLQSRYLLGLCLYMVLFSVTSTFLYFQQAALVHRYFTDAGARTTYFAVLDLVVNILTLGTQTLLTGRLLRWLGVPTTLALIPALGVVGFTLLGWWPTLSVLVAFAALRRAGNFALARPAREILFTVLPREEKYKAKTFIDTVAYRLGDQIGAWAYAGIGALGLAAGPVALLAVPLSAAWLWNSVWLGKRQARMAAAEQNPAAGPRG